jgi:hypothetical protein
VVEGVGQREQKSLKNLHLLVASWREGDKMRNVHLASTRKMDMDARLARQERSVGNLKQ